MNFSGIYERKENESWGEMSAEEARKFVDDLVQQAQQGTVPANKQTQEKEPRRIEIVDEVEATSPKTETASPKSNSDDLRQQVQSLQEELRRLKRE